MEIIRKILIRFWAILSYLIFGALTTFVNYLVYLPMYHIVGLPAALSNAVAWALAVTFAFLTNKPFVFHSYDWSAETVIPELKKFLATRIVSGLIETGILLVSVDILRWDGNVMKLVTSALIIILNYVGSKFFVFRK